jgi:Domain of unknown function (DUF3784)
MNNLLLITAAVLFALAFLIGVKKQTWILSGFNQQRVHDQDRLAKLVGSYTFIIGLAMLVGAFIDHPNTQILFPVMVIGYVIILGYVNTKMVK